MPIAREHRWLYPIDWRELSAFIRFGRAKGRCEHCRRPHGRDVLHLGDGRWWDEDARRWRDGQGRGVRRLAAPADLARAQPGLAGIDPPTALRVTRVILASAHLILRDVPGVAVGRVPGQTQIRLRGAEGNHTLVLVDGIEVSDPFAGEFDFGTLVADDAARIEVLRGQQSAIYGSDAIGGVIQPQPEARKVGRLGGRCRTVVDPSARLGSRDRDCGSVDALASAHLAAVDRKIADLAALRRELAALLTSCRGGAVSECRILEAFCPVQPV